MEFNEFITTLNKLPEQTKRVLYSSMLSTMLGIKNVENEMFDVKAIPTTSQEMNIDQGKTLSQLFHENINNHKTKEYKDKFYKILKLADKYSNENYSKNYMTGNDRYVENELVKLLTEVRKSNSENELEIIENDVYLVNDFQHTMFNEPAIYDSKKIKIGRLKEVSAYKIETVCDKIIFDKKNQKLSFKFEDMIDMRTDLFINLTNGLKSVMIYKNYDWVIFNLLGSPILKNDSITKNSVLIEYKYS